VPIFYHGFTIIDIKDLFIVERGKLMPVIKYGYSGGTKTPEQFAVWSGWTRLHPEMQRRVMALIV
jgi:hypothetical protein